LRLVSYKRKDGASRLGALSDQGVIDLETAAQSAGVPTDAFSGMSFFLAAGESALAQATNLLKAPPLASVVPLADVHLLPPVPRPGKIIAVGLNYRDHSMESGAAAPPKSPILFAKFPNSIAGPEDPIVIPAGDPLADYEAELALVIGSKAKAVSAEKALETVAGYMPLNDVSARAWQFSDKQWVRGKSPDTFCPTGPYLTTRDDVPDPHSLSICARVNGVTLQDSNTSKMIFRIPQLIEFISASITLEPGDIIATGTPEGVGAFRKPPIYLKPGDVVEIEIQHLGVLRNNVVAE
jgi:2-keto-4-pentenoate hydratase/2-oxohepta-3-ene-1,7-dioic acid hydratase in catechol pathway